MERNELSRQLDEAYVLSGEAHGVAVGLEVLAEHEGAGHATRSTLGMLTQRLDRLHELLDITATAVGAEEFTQHTPELTSLPFSGDETSEEVRAEIDAGIAELGGLKKIRRTVAAEGG